MRLILILFFGLLSVTARAETALIGVATNFRPAAEALAEAFEKETGHRVTLASGATGKLAAQISNGAPFDAFLSADADTPDRLSVAGYGVRDTRFTYATGAIVLWSANSDLHLSDPVAALKAAHHIAIANPALAPYGKAARQTLETIGLYEQVSNRIVVGENIGQTYALTASGAAELGFIAASARPGTGAFWPVPQGMHAPIRQDALLLRHGAGNVAARSFLDWLRGGRARSIIREFGYEPGA